MFWKSLRKVIFILTVLMEEFKKWIHLSPQYWKKFKTILVVDQMIQRMMGVTVTNMAHFTAETKTSVTYIMHGGANLTHAVAGPTHIAAKTTQGATNTTNRLCSQHDTRCRQHNKWNRQHNTWCGWHKHGAADMKHGSVATKIENGPKTKTKILRILKMDRRRRRRIFGVDKNLRRSSKIENSSKIFEDPKILKWIGLFQKISEAY